eukprot:11201586-Lingulodinium_polyedra.AAC.1
MFQVGAATACKLVQEPTICHVLAYAYDPGLFDRSPRRVWRALRTRSQVLARRRLCTRAKDCRATARSGVKS